MGKLLKKPKFLPRQQTGIIFLLTIVAILTMVFYSIQKQESIEIAKALGETHPFLIVTEDMYPELRARANNQPWSDMKNEAKNFVNNNFYDDNASATDKHYRIRWIASAGALVYILDPANKESYKNKVRDALMKWDNALETIIETEISWNKHVPTGSSFVMSVLALDIIYNDLTPAERSAIESRLGLVEQEISPKNTWYLNKYAIKGTWNLYNGNIPAANTDITNYKNHLKSYLSDDGVFNEGSGYGWARMNGVYDRGIAKTGFMDITEFIGLANFYDDPLYAELYEWMYAGAWTPFRYLIAFGDSAIVPYSGRPTFRMNSTRLFSDKAAGYASWLHQNSNHEYAATDLLLTYVLMDQLMPAPEKPQSTIWSDGGAAFWEDNPSEHSLMGVLYNIKSSQGHTHFDTNAIHIAAFGENILRNSGYNGWDLPIEGYSWDWIHSTSQANNIVQVQGDNHLEKIGAGLTEGFTGSLFDYASGDSGAAVKNGQHQRNFTMIHPQDSAEGYFVLFDEITLDDPSYFAEVYLHPDSASYVTVIADQEYKWTINHYSEHNVYANIFLATPVERTIVLKGGMATFRDNYETEYLSSRYVPRSGSQANAVTVIFPSDDAHPKADMTRISGAEFSGAMIDLGNNIYDYAIESYGTSLINHSTVSLQGLASLYRMQNGNNRFYFVRQGTSFDDGASQRHGFESDSDVSLHFKDKVGNIVSSGTNVTIYYPGISGLNINGQAVSLISSGDGWVKANVQAGTHDILLVTDGVVIQEIVGDWSLDGDVLDDSGNNNHGTNNGAGFTTDRFGNPNSALSFDGTNDYVNLPTGDFAGLADATISLWVKFFETGTQSLGVWTYKQGPTDSYDYLIIDGHGGDDYDTIRFELKGSSGPIIVALIDDTPYTLDTWYKVDAVCGNSGAKLYVNGDLKDSDSTTFCLADIPSGTVEHAVGRLIFKDPGPYYFSGIVDDVKIYSRALNEAEILNNYIGAGSCLGADFDCSQTIDTLDLNTFKSLWGQPGKADFNQNNITNTSDLGIMMSTWGNY